MMTNYFKLIGFTLLISIVLTGCSTTFITPDGEVTPNDELEAMINV